jgi:uncharacterized protein
MCEADEWVAAAAYFMKIEQEPNRTGTAMPGPNLVIDAADGQAALASSVPRPRSSWTTMAGLKRLLTESILHLNDSPHSIAMGVFLGFFIGWTPTPGIQALLYLVAATILRVNKVSGLLLVWLTNPLTAVPIYYSNWVVGRVLLTGNAEPSEAVKSAIQEMVGVGGPRDVIKNMGSAEFWQKAWSAFVEMGVELWVGSVVVGLILGAIAYYVTLRAVVSYRLRQKQPFSP